MDMDADDKLTHDNGAMAVDISDLASLTDVAFDN